MEWTSRTRLWALLFILHESTGVDRSHNKISRKISLKSQSPNFYLLNHLQWIIYSHCAFETVLVKVIIRLCVANPGITSLYSPYSVTLQCICSWLLCLSNALSSLGFYDTAFSFYFIGSFFLVVRVGCFSAWSKCQSATQLGEGPMLFFICFSP